MSQVNTDQSRWQALLPVLNDHVAWFNALLVYIFYPEHRVSDKPPQKPNSFALWFLEASRDPHFQSEIIGKLNALHKDLMAHADSLVLEVQNSNTKPSYESFQSFMAHFDEFTMNIRRLEHDFMIENSGYDLLTGLRNPKLLELDIERELERLGRQGKTFTIALARVDYFDQIETHYSKTETQSYIKLVAELIKLSIRSFDDAYYLGRDKFLLVLKQSEIKGGIAALERLKKELERQDIEYAFGPNNQKMSVSCCIAAPNSTDNIKDLITHLEEDLSKNTDRISDGVLEYFEISPLQRFVRESTGQ